MNNILALTIATLFAIGASPVKAQQGDGTRVSIPISIFKPAKVEPTPERLAGIKAPPGFSVSVFASGLKNTRIVVAAPNGVVYVSRRDQGDVLMLRDANNDGRTDSEPVVVASRAGMHGLAVRDNRLYMVTVKEVFVADIRPDGRLGPLKMLAGDLPDAGQHPNRTLAFGPDGMLYISVGSSCNVCNESNPENATILRMSPDGKQRTIFAAGLRNTIGFDWHPQTGELWGMDHGIDFLGDEQQPEELNRIELGKQYGWPHVYADGQIYPQSTPVGDISKEEWKSRSTPMALGYSAHAAPMQMLFYTGNAFPAEYQGDAFVTMRGSWNRMSPSGYEIVRMRFSSGQASSIEPFVTGFLTDNRQTHIARPIGLAKANDGSLLMADDANGVLYRVAYTGNDAAIPNARNASPPSAEMRLQAIKGADGLLAFQRAETRSEARITVHSESFKHGGTLPRRHSEYAEGVSPSFSWSPVQGAKSYVVIMEDPDATPTRPFIHWLAWNIPASATSLREGLQEQPRLTEPDGVLQGRNTRGSIGYYGPRPPVGDAPHHYHFQVLALDKVLDVPFGSDRDTLLEAVRGHVLAKGEIIGTYAQKAEALK
ncbi:MAG: YbhB/YbcL family Raf kinase inhibitor-like protein [Noviherbaspirillum sp.]